MSEPNPAPKSNRTPWIIAGVLGCLVLCLLVAIVGGGFYFITQNTAAPTRPVVVVQPSSASSVQSSVQPPASSASSVQSSVQPPVVSSSATSVLPPIVSSATSGQPPVVSSATSTQPPVVSSASSTVSSATSKPPAAPQGRLAFTVRRGDRPEDNYVWIMNADGSGAKEILKRSSEPTFSPDGTKIAFYRWTDGLFVANADGTDVKKVLGESNSGYMSWSHDGRWIAFSVRPGRAGNIVTDAIAPDGTGRRPVVVGWSPSWSPDDSQVVFQTCRDTSGCGIFRASSAGGDAIPIITDDGGLPTFSPDGKRVLYQKDADGQKQLFIINADGSGKKQLTQGPALHASANWSLDGNFIFYRSPEGGQWGIWRMNADGTNPVKIANDMPPGDWPYDRIAVSK